MNPRRMLQYMIYNVRGQYLHMNRRERGKYVSDTVLFGYFFQEEEKVSHSHSICLHTTWEKAHYSYCSMCIYIYQYCQFGNYDAPCNVSWYRKKNNTWLNLQTPFVKKNVLSPNFVFVLLHTLHILSSSFVALMENGTWSKAIAG